MCLPHVFEFDRYWFFHKMLRNDLTSRIKYFFIFCMTSLVLVPLVMPDSSFALKVISHPCEIFQ